MSLALLPLTLMALLAQRAAWVPDVPEGPDPIGDIDVSDAPRGIVPLPGRVDPRIKQWFGRYTRVMAPNGKPLHILAQDGWSDDQIVRVRKVLEHILTDVPGSKYGADKTEVKNEMSRRRATLVLFNTERDLHRALRGSFGELELGCQDLRANECPVEGGADYMRHDTRDAAFEEILHLVHDYGLRPALREYDKAIHRANVAARKADLWDAWPEDEPENHRNEYLAAVYDNYLDLWSVPPTKYEGNVLEEGDIPPGTSHFGHYRAGSRAALLEKDPQGYALVEAFLAPQLTYTPELPEDFRGTFSLQLDPKLRYTTKSHHLTNVTLTGKVPASLRGNDRNNRLQGNAGNNTLRGAGGDDHLQGGEGRDTAVFAGKRLDYTVQRGPGPVKIVDTVKDRDGTDVIEEIEVLRFADETVDLD